jgi:hypothetical protein
MGSANRICYLSNQCFGVNFFRLRSDSHHGVSQPILKVLKFFARTGLPYPRYLRIEMKV